MLASSEKDGRGCQDGQVARAGWSDSSPGRKLDGEAGHWLLKKAHQTRESVLYKQYTPSLCCPVPSAHLGSFGRADIFKNESLPSTVKCNPSLALGKIRKVALLGVANSCPWLFAFNQTGRCGPISAK